MRDSHDLRFPTLRSACVPLLLPAAIAAELHAQQPAVDCPLGPPIPCEVRCLAVSPNEGCAIGDIDSLGHKLNTGLAAALSRQLDAIAEEKRARREDREKAGL